MEYVYRDGSRLTPWMKHCIDLLDAEMWSRFGVHVAVTSGIRTYAEQEALFRARYTLNPAGRHVYDRKVWQGRTWYRISAAGTVAPPGSSNHEIQGTTAAVDLRDSGRDPGIASGGNPRANWLRSNALRFGLFPSGYGFGEPWHFDISNIFSPVADAPTSGAGGGGAGQATIDLEEEDMLIQVKAVDGEKRYSETGGVFYLTVGIPGGGAIWDGPYPDGNSALANHIATLIGHNAVNVTYKQLEAVAKAAGFQLPTR